MTGGGSAGHVTPNLALIPKLKEKGFEVQYIGTVDGIEKKIIADEKIKYHAISSGKLRRYFDVKNFTDPFKVIKGIFEAKKIIKREKPDVVFSKGGFVAVPVVMGAFFNKVPVVAHESDMTPGLANKLSLPYCTKICVTFPETLAHIKKGKGEITGTPIRQELLQGSKIKGKEICKFSSDKPVLLVIGGSLGSRVINEALRGHINEVTERFSVIHICGKGNLDKAIKNNSYRQFEYVREELPHLMALSDIVLSRSGANSIYELLALKKPNLLIPLSKKSSRGDQILNAKSFEKNGYSMVLLEEELNDETLLNNINKLYENKDRYIENMSKSGLINSTDKIVDIIVKSVKK